MMRFCHTLSHALLRINIRRHRSQVYSFCNACRDNDDDGGGGGSCDGVKDIWLVQLK